MWFVDVPWLDPTPLDLTPEPDHDVVEQGTSLPEQEKIKAECKGRALIHNISMLLWSSKILERNVSCALVSR